MTAFRLVLLGLLFPAGGCAALVGDDCQEQTDCGGRSMYCEYSMPGGYCTVRDCTRNSCPAEGVCIEFDNGVSYCMRACDSDDDCRDGYRCFTEFGPHPFCNDELGKSDS